ncbi:hypothetical protein LTR85_008633 [Meristemomyces frigidus]|nr:hypothetical protein LTR85_008633 [Meristemomyces frigidus]
MSFHQLYTPEWAIFRNAVSELIGLHLLDVFDLLHSVPSEPLPEDGSENERRKISTTVYCAERDLLEHQSRIQSGAGQPSYGRLFSYAAMLYITVALRDFPLGAARLGSVVRWLDDELTSLIHKKSLDEMSQAELVLILWMRMVQLIATPKERLGPQLVPSLRSISKALDIESVASLASTLRQIVWSDGLITSCLERLFSESAVS